MRRWLKIHLLPGLIVSACAVVFLQFGFRFDGPTFVFTLVATFLADAVRDALR